MKATSSIKILLVLIMSFHTISCGTETLLFIVAFSATWDVEGDSDHTIEFRQDMENVGVPMGIFTGRERHQSDPTKDDNLLAGTFNEKSIEFIIQRRGIGKEIKYTGTLEAPGPRNELIFAEKMTLNSPHDGSLVMLPQ